MWFTFFMCTLLSLCSQYMWYKVCLHFIECSINFLPEIMTWLWRCLVGSLSAFDALRVMPAGDLGPGPSEDLLNPCHNTVLKRKNAPFRGSACYTATAKRQYFLSISVVWDHRGGAGVPSGPVQLGEDNRLQNISYLLKKSTLFGVV